MDASSDGSIEGMIRAARRVLNIIDNETKIIPGHGPLGNKADLNNFLNMLIAVKNTMQDLIDQGKTIEEIIALNPNAELDKTWGNGFLNPETFLRVLHSVMPK
jgi:cyclase